MWYVRDTDSSEVGPLVDDALIEMIQDGRAHAETAVRHEGYEGFQPIDTVPRFAKHLKGARPRSASAKPPVFASAGHRTYRIGNLGDL